jgi:hypothetical protein
MCPYDPALRSNYHLGRLLLSETLGTLRVERLDGLESGPMQVTTCAFDFYGCGARFLTDNCRYSSGIRHTVLMHTISSFDGDH